jgi:putative endonuclease
MQHIELGKKGESVAKEYLLKKGFVFLAMNWRFDRYEVDLIMRDKNQIVFVEVKTRSSESYGSPADAVRFDKRRNLIRAAHLYIVSENCSLEPRFDIVAVIEKKNASPNIVHFEEAFIPFA